MDTNILFIFILAVFVGFEVISKVPSMLHTPLMSGTNAVHGIILLGGMLVLSAADSPLSQALVFVAVAVTFILGMKFLSSPKTARVGNLVAAGGMLVAFLATIPLMQWSQD